MEVGVDVRIPTAVFVAVLLWSANALAQGKGGPNMDPLGDHDHGESGKAASPDAPGAGPAKVVIKQRIVRVTKTRTTSPGPKKAVASAPPKSDGSPAATTPTTTTTIKKTSERRSETQRTTTRR